MKKNQLNNNNNLNNYSQARSNYVNPKTQNINYNTYRNQQSVNIGNKNNQMQFNSPLSATINYKNQKQNDDSSNFSKPYEDFSKT